MKSICDLHTHSTASDGQYAPAELVSMAHSRGIEVLALTDHDTVDGVEEAVRAGEALGMRVIRGIELSAREYPTFHILGYGFRPDAPALAALCADMKAGRDRRKYRMLDYLRDQGVPITLEEVEAVCGGEIVARPHFARVLVARGYVSTNREAFDRYLDTPEFHARVERKKPSAAECVEILKAAGGVVSLAHPYQTGLPADELEELVRKMAGWGLDAIECYYPKYSPEQQALYLSLAERYGLHITGGSDFHGEKVKPEISLARLSLDLSWLP